MSYKKTTWTYELKVVEFKSYFVWHNYLILVQSELHKPILYYMVKKNLQRCILHLQNVRIKLDP